MWLQFYRNRQWFVRLIVKKPSAALFMDHRVVVKWYKSNTAVTAKQYTQTETLWLSTSDHRTHGFSWSRHQVIRYVLTQNSSVTQNQPVMCKTTRVNHRCLTQCCCSEMRSQLIKQCDLWKILFLTSQQNVVVLRHQMTYWPQLIHSMQNYITSNYNTNFSRKDHNNNNIQIFNWLIWLYSKFKNAVLLTFSPA